MKNILKFTQMNTVYMIGYQTFTITKRLNHSKKEYARNDDNDSFFEVIHTTFMILMALQY
jgi:hypothetical protein